MTGLVGLGLGWGDLPRRIAYISWVGSPLRVQKAEVYGQGCSGGLVLDDDQEYKLSHGIIRRNLDLYSV